MKTIYVSEFGGPEQLKLVDQDTPEPGAGEVLVEVAAAGINFADLLARQGIYPPVPSAPFYPGFEIAGTVSALGQGVTRVKVGDPVMAMVPGGGYSSHALVKAESVLPRPDSLEPAQATALLIQGLTAFFLLELGGAGPGHKVLIPSAAGGVGSLAVQMARAMGCQQVIGLASPGRHSHVRELGATDVFDYSQSGWAARVLEATGGSGVDAFLDSQGDLSGEGFLTLGKLSHWLIYGGQAQDPGVLTSARLWEMIFRDITLRGYSLYSSVEHFGRGLSALGKWVESGALKVSVQAFPLVEASQAHRAIAARQTTGKVVLVP